MGLFNSFMNNIGYVRYSNGSNWYKVTQGNTTYIDGQDKLGLAINHSVLSSLISIRADYLSKVRFYIEESNGDKNFEDPLLDFINNPNPHQSKEDFLIQFEWFLCSYGWVYQRPYLNTRDKGVKYIYNLNPSKIQFPKKMGNSIIITKSDERNYYSKEFSYQDVDTTKSIKFLDIIPYYDVSNSTNNNENSSVTSPSRLDSIIRELSNFTLASDAENITLQTNGKQILFSDSAGNALGTVPLQTKDKQAIKNILNSPLGFKKGERILTADKKIGLVDATIPIKNLGLNESRETNANVISQRLQVPNEIYKAFTQGATFENQKQAQVSFVQNVTQPRADDLASSFTTSFGDPNRPYKASFEHLPFMQAVEDEKANKALRLSQAMRNLIQSGLDESDAREFIANLGISVEI